MRVGSADSTRMSSSLVALDGTITRLAWRTAVRVAERKNEARGLSWSGSVNHVVSCTVTTVGRPALSGME